MKNEVKKIQESLENLNRKINYSIIEKNHTPHLAYELLLILQSAISDIEDDEKAFAYEQVLNKILQC